MVNVPCVDALRVHFGDSPRKCVFADARRKLHPAFASEFFRIVQADNAPLGIENHRGGNDWTKQRPASGFIDAGNAQPAQFARGTLETGGAKSAHWFGATLIQHRRRLPELLPRYLTSERRETKASVCFIHSAGRPWGP